MPEKRFKRSDFGMISGLIEGREISGNLCVISPSTVCSIDRVKELLWTRGSKCVLATEEVSRETKKLIMNVQRHKGCEFVCLHRYIGHMGIDGIPSEALQKSDNYLVLLGEVVAITNSPVIAEALEEAARSGLRRVLVRGQFETGGGKEVVPIILEAVSRSGTEWIWDEDPNIRIADIVDDIDIVDIGVSVGSIDNCGEFWDEYTGERLPSEEVAKARSDEIDGLKQYKVIEKATIEECWKQTGKRPIGVRWIDCNKGGFGSSQFQESACREGN